MRTTLRRDRAWIIVGVIVVGAIVLLITAVSMADERATDIWVNLADSAAQIVVLALAGGVVGAVLRDRDARREDNRRSQASLLAFANQVELAFNEIKAARRILRTFGFDAPAGRTLTGEQATGFRAQMAQLNDTELSVEMYARVVEAQRSLFEPNAESLQHELAGCVAIPAARAPGVGDRLHGRRAGRRRLRTRRLEAFRRVRRLRRRVEPGVPGRHRRAAHSHRTAADEQRVAGCPA